MKHQTVKMGLVLAAVSLGGFAGCYTKLMPFRDAVAVRKASVAQSERAGNFTSNIDYRDNCLSCHSEAELNDRAAEMDYAGVYTVHGVTYDPYGWQNPYSQPPWWDPTPPILVSDPGWGDGYVPRPGGNPGGGYNPGSGYQPGVGNQPIGGYSPGSGYQPSGGTPAVGGRQPVITTQPTVPSTPASATSSNGKRRRDTGTTRTGSDTHQANPTATSTPSGGTSTPSSTPSGSGGVTTTPPATTQAPAPAPAADTRSRGTEGSGTRKSGSGRD